MLVIGEDHFTNQDAAYSRISSTNLGGLQQTLAFTAYEQELPVRVVARLVGLLNDPNKQAFQKLLSEHPDNQKYAAKILLSADMGGAQTLFATKNPGANTVQGRLIIERALRREERIYDVAESVLRATINNVWQLYSDAYDEVRSLLAVGHISADSENELQSILKTSPALKKKAQLEESELIRRIKAVVEAEISIGDKELGLPPQTSPIRRRGGGQISH